MKENKIEDRKYVVYKHTSPNNKVYIGITGQYPPEKRWANGYGYTQNEYFRSEIIEYGWNNFQHEILFDNLTKSEARQKEKELILFYKSTDKELGYNVISGNLNELPNELRKKIRHNTKNIIPVMQFTLSGEFVKKYDSVTIAGEETNICISNIAKCCKEKLKSAGNYVWRYADCNLNSITYNHKTNKQVTQYTKNGVSICVHNSIIEASVKSNVDQSSITKCCKGKLQTAGGYIWKYTDENNMETILGSVS